MPSNESKPPLRAASAIFTDSSMMACGLNFLKIKAWMAQPGTVVPECEKPNVEEQKPQENVQMKESGIRELKKTENTQSSVVEKLGKPVYNGYRLVENKSEKEIASNATVNENISEKDT